MNYKKGKVGLNIKTKKAIWCPPQLKYKIQVRADKMGIAKWVWLDWFIKVNEK